MKPSKSDWLIPAALIVLSLVPALAGTARLVEISDSSNLTPQNARFFASPWPVFLHIPAAILYSILGALQFSPAFRRRYREWHRAAGRVLIPAGIVVAVSGLWMTLSYPWPRGDGVAVFVERLVFGAAMLVAIGLGIEAIRQRRFAQHGEWMVRAYAIGLGAGTQVFTHLPWFLFVDLAPGELPRGVMMGAGWVVNVVVAEWIIRNRMRRPASAPRAGGGTVRTALVPPAVGLT